MVEIGLEEGIGKIPHRQTRFVHRTPDRLPAKRDDRRRNEDMVFSPKRPQLVCRFLPRSGLVEQAAIFRRKYLIRAKHKCLGSPLRQLARKSVAQGKSV